MRWRTYILGLSIVALSLSGLLAAAPEGGNRLTVGYGPADDGCTISITSDRPAPDDERTARRLAYLDLLMAELGGRVEVTPESTPSEYTLYLPRSRPDRQAIV